MRLVTHGPFPRTTRRLAARAGLRSRAAGCDTGDSTGVAHLAGAADTAELQRCAVGENIEKQRGTQTIGTVG